MDHITCPYDMVYIIWPILYGVIRSKMGWEIAVPMIIRTFAGIPTAQNNAYIIGFAFSTFSVSLRNNLVYSKIRRSQNLSMALHVRMHHFSQFSDSCLVKWM